MRAEPMLKRLRLGAKRSPDWAKIRDTANLEVVLPWALATEVQEVRYPVAYVEFLRGCLELQRTRIDTVKRPRSGGDSDSRCRFSSLLGALASPPPLGLEVARRLARIADEWLCDSTPIQSGTWAGYIGAHFEMTSSFGHRGRILSTVVRFMGTTRCLELGTAYGMSALFLLEAMAAHGADGRLTTVDGSEPLFQVASRLLDEHYPGQVDCRLGWNSAVLPGLVGEIEPVQLLFHDAGHSAKDYTNDFRAALPALAPGAVVLIDDIDWYDPRFCIENPRCHAGWLEVTRHPRVRWAAEIDRSLGIALLD